MSAQGRLLERLDERSVNQGDDLKELGAETRGLRRALITFGLSVLAGGLLFYLKVAELWG